MNNIITDYKMINVIAACEINSGIGYKNKIPWYYKFDMMFFKKMTLEKNILMGKNTWLSIPNTPLKKRTNIVLTTKNNIQFPDNVIVYNNFDDVVNDYKEIWVIGGENVYKKAFEHKKFKTLYLTRIMAEYNCDKFLPQIPNNYKKTTINRIIENNTELIFEKYDNI